MKKLLFAALPILLVIACKKNCPDCETCPKPDCISNLDSGLLLYYPFNGNFNDVSGNGINGTPMNGAKLGADALGRPNQALDLDGVNDYVVANPGGKLKTDEVSVSFQVMVRNVNRRHAFLGLQNFDNTAGQTWGFGQTFDQTNHWDFVIDEPTNDCATPYTYADGKTAQSPENSVAGKWYHIVGVFNKKGEQKIYVNGELRSTLNRNFQALKKCDNVQFLVGAWWKDDIVSTDGVIDEVRIYNRELSSCEIADLGKLSYSNSTGN